MNSELILTVLKLFNTVFCFFIIAILFWHNSKNNIHSIRITVSSIILLLSLILQVIYPSSFDALYTFVSLLVILFLLFDNHSMFLKNSTDNPSNTDELITQSKEQERSRIYANLHDDIGAKLLELIYTAKDDESKNLAKHILKDIRQAVASTVNIQCNVNQLANEIVQETENRLRSSKIAFSQNIQIDNPKQKLTATVPSVISRICREAMSNTIKHSQANHVQMFITSSAKELKICIIDDGIGFNNENTIGKGLKTINKRAQSISSVVKWNSQPQKGTKFSLVYSYGN